MLRWQSHNRCEWRLWGLISTFFGAGTTHLPPPIFQLPSAQNTHNMTLFIKPTLPPRSRHLLLHLSLNYQSYFSLNLLIQPLEHAPHYPPDPLSHQKLLAVLRLWVWVTVTARGGMGLMRGVGLLPPRGHPQQLLYVDKLLLLVVRGEIKWLGVAGGVVHSIRYFQYYFDGNFVDYSI